MPQRDEASAQDPEPRAAERRDFHGRLQNRMPQRDETSAEDPDGEPNVTRLPRRLPHRETSAEDSRAESGEFYGRPGSGGLKRSGMDSLLSTSSGQVAVVVYRLPSRSRSTSSAYGGWPTSSRTRPSGARALSATLPQPEGCSVADAVRLYVDRRPSSDVTVRRARDRVGVIPR